MLILDAFSSLSKLDYIEYRLVYRAKGHDESFLLPCSLAFQRMCWGWVNSLPLASFRARGDVLQSSLRNWTSTAGPTGVAFQEGEGTFSA